MKRSWSVCVLAPLCVLAGGRAAAWGEDLIDRGAPGVLVRLYEVDAQLRAVPELAPGQLPNVVKELLTIDLGPDEFAPMEDSFFTTVDGFLNVRQAGEYVFRLISDDGSILRIDGEVVVDHDGLHGAEPKDGTVELAVGQHELNIRHFDAGGAERLLLLWKPPGAEEYEIVPAGVLTHERVAEHATATGKKRIIPPLRRGRPGDGAPVAGLHPAAQIGTGGQLPDSVMFVGSAAVGIIGRPLLPGVNEQPLLWVPGRAGPRKTTTFPWIWQSHMPPAITTHTLVQSGDSIFRVVMDPVRHAPGAAAADTCAAAFRFADGVDTCVTHIQNAGATVFEMNRVRAMNNGLEIEFTKPLDPRCGWDPECYYVEQWPFDVKGGEGPRRDGVVYPVKSASVAADARRVFLEIADLKVSHVVYLRLLPPCYSVEGEQLWGTEAWFTLNALPADRLGEIGTPPEAAPQNYLTAEEQAAGWRLLFDGQTTDGWRGYRKDHFPAGWVVKDGSLTRVGPGGDICTVEEFDSFELQIEWRIGAGGNSGIFFRVDEKAGWAWETGPEFQVLDNSLHADGGNPLTSAGADYALHAPLRDVTAPVGFFNRARIVVAGAHVEHWLNDVKIVEYELGSADWLKRVAESKFAGMPRFGRAPKGRIVLQDHGDSVWYRNIKIRPLPAATGGR